MAFSRDCLDTVGVCPERVKHISVGQRCAGDFRLDLVGPDGLPVDLTKYDIPPGSESSNSSSSSGPILSSWSSSSSTPPDTRKHGVECVAKEMWFSPHPLFVAMANMPSVEDARQGIIHLHINKQMSKHAGVWLGMATIYQHGAARSQYPYYYDVAPDIKHRMRSAMPLTVYEVRLAMRDTCPQMNFLIDRVDFQPEEIMWAIRYPIDEWNEALPPIQLYTCDTFPFRAHWMKAVIGRLLKMASIWLRRNDLPYQAAGLTVDDTKKWAEYEQLGEQYLQEWKEFVKNKKISINIAGGYARVGGWPSWWF